MEISEAKNAIGQPFKWSLCVKWDVIRSVTDDGFIIGDFITAPIEETRLKQEQPPQLVKHQKQNNG